MHTLSIIIFKHGFLNVFSSKRKKFFVSLGANVCLKKQKPWSKVAAHNGLWILKRCRPYCAASKIQGSDHLKKIFFFLFIALMIVMSAVP